ncbi:hypothetical protein CPB84DRAFT_1854315 [Gymnopilus junonius]|uniref:Uncharacterized protein n=1 Tax=Gymnopilus junonius TaxID=109634 RepID=A0A9P5TGA6_GYMJU|nr:hypothetical protein CPB84DRAFT_1854315 [Gymnopilus junonius]
MDKFVYPMTPPNAASQPSGSLDRQDQLDPSESPLTSLVRRTSSRRTRWQMGAGHQAQEQFSGSSLQRDTYEHDVLSSQLDTLRRSSPLQGELEAQYAYAYQPAEYRPNSSSSYRSYYSQLSSYSSEQANFLHVQMADLNFDSQPSNGLTSPLLHSHFVRDSFATASSSDNYSNWDPEYSGREYRTSSSPTNEGDHGKSFAADTDMSWRGSSAGIILPASRNSAASNTTIHRPDDFAPNSNSQTSFEPRTSKLSPPSIVISAETIVQRQASASREGPGKALLVKPLLTPGFSTSIPHSEGQRATPQLPPDMKEQKIKVLERNIKRQRSRSPVAVKCRHA